MTTTPDALALLDADHAQLLQLFASFRELSAHGAQAARRKALAEQICLELTIHARLEDELFYPALRQAMGDEDLLDEAEVAHASARDLMVQVLAMRPQDELYDAKVTVLGEYVQQHVRFEREQLFGCARRCGLDLARLAQRLQERQAELRAVPEALREDLLAQALA